MKYILRGAVIPGLFLLFVSLILLAGYISRPPTEKEQVYSACNEARQEINMFTENYCGALQDEYKLKFVCESRDNNPNTKCKVEEKK